MMSVISGHVNVVRVMRTMWDLLLDTFFNALKNIEERVPPLQTILKDSSP